MASTSTSSPPAATLKLDANVKLATDALLPFAIASHISESQPQSITVQWEKGTKDAVQIEANGQVLNGPEPVSKWMLNAYAHTGIAGSDHDQSSAISAYLEQALSLATLPFPAAVAQANTFDDHLALRTFLVGHSPTAADIAIWAGIRGCPPLLGILKKGTHVHLARWNSHIDALCKSAQSEFQAAKVGKVKTGDEAAAGKKGKAADPPTQAKSFDIFLPSAKEGEVVTRFPPEPSGYLHLGHTKAAILNQYFAREYKGKLIVRFDDTNPTKEKAEFEESIIEDLALLGIRPDKTTYTSDSFDIIYQYVIQLIKQGDAYADDTQQEEMRAQRMDGIASARRDMSVEETLERFADMSSGSAEGRKWCLRAKMSVDDPNKALRDPVIYRCNPDVVHHRTGTKYKVYPTYDFACPVVDSLEGITHALRTNEYRDRNPQFAWFIEKLKLRNVEIWDFGRLNFQYTLLSKRKLTWFVDNGYVRGWDDPRFPTVRGIRRRGMSIEALQQFILATGPSQQILNMEWDAIWTLNKRIIDPVVPRFWAIEKENKVKCTIAGAPPAHEKAVPKHKKNLDVGTKTTVYDSTIWMDQEDAQSFGDNEEITIMDWGNVYVRAKKMAADGSGVVEGLELEANFDGDFKKTKKKIHWLADSKSRPLVDVTLMDFDYLITKPKLEEDDKFEDFVTPETEFHTEALADHNVLELKEGDKMQFERKGYYILDKINKETGKLEFFKIPDGKASDSRSKNNRAAAIAAGKESATTTDKRERSSKAKADGSGAGAGAAGQPAFGELADGGQVKSSMYKMKPLVSDVDTGSKSSGMYNVKPIHSS